MQLEMSRHKRIECERNVPLERAEKEHVKDPEYDFLTDNPQGSPQSREGKTIALRKFPKDRARGTLRSVRGEKGETEGPVFMIDDGR